MPAKILYFRSNSCAPCRATSPVVAEYASLPESLDVEIVNVESNFETAMKYGVRSLPQLILIDEESNEIERVPNPSQITVNKLLEQFDH